jgi:NAD(P)-dependent dehydrogenase (short-subunit alcohol dehydrogenase family)
MPFSTVLIAGASRGLGLGIARAYAARGVQVIATARDPHRAKGLAELREAHPDRVRVEALDVTHRASAEALAGRLGDTRPDLLFVVAGQGAHMNTPIEDVPPEDAAREFATNAHGPLVVAECLAPRLAPHATVAFMTSILGSIASSNGGMDLYRASKAALNMLAVGFAKRHAGHPVLLIHPGWVRTELGGDNAPLDIETSVDGMLSVLDRHTRAGVAYLDYKGDTLPW